ncbi:MAG: hypothetical protein I3273_03490 [Candidatus Moeniiplasma glomeromycotorum]|nr:hypothetical protein [Candidatus Moeniiplasma glomeromycotorum]MCE8162168.1 hypothetical protein [Candidatus Moeniiplasma glomeromycotorum]MCE8163372.1 hypothetical protein [Candidatus Moeniiplasma glomeromycotorum]MCE8166177.1 hypothetical protein [Candidatus Moeniiplasma glomeromycotorum]MCE8166567.1 hypothetical protein [Candidatus Moeniiplasma glomeromycotorum]
MSDYAYCPKCEKDNPLLTPYYRCYRCGFKEKKYGKSNNYEREQRKIVEEIIKTLTIGYKVKIRFIGKTNRPRKYGWTIKTKDRFTIFIPRKTFYLPNDELVDTVGHEPSHIVNWDEIDTNPKNSSEEDHGPKWYKDYRENKDKILKNKKFREFANSFNPQVKFKKTYKIYPSIYEEEYNKNILKKN